MLVSYPIIPPSKIKPASFKGFSSGLFSPFSYCSYVDFASCLSLTRLLSPPLYITVNQSPLAAHCNASITHESAPCVTAVDNWENL